MLIRFNRVLLSCTLLSVVALFAGCSSDEQSATNKTDSQTKAQQDAQSDAEPDEAPEIAQALAKLSPEDRALAEKQQTCPVSGEKLGSMDVPVKVNVKDRDVFLCCSSCEDSLKKDPDKYLAKLKQ